MITTMLRAVPTGRTESADFAYDVALSFAGEDRAYVHEVAARLRDRGVSVFYDEFFRAEMWGKDLVEHLDDVYRRGARFCVLFISEHYARKLWTRHERKSAQARALEQNGEYLLPARFDETELPGLSPTLGYIDLRGIDPVAFADLVCEKVEAGREVSGDRAASGDTPPAAARAEDRPAAADRAAVDRPVIDEMIRELVDRSADGVARDRATERAVGRNDPCPCGSGRKYKKCHGAP